MTNFLTTKFQVPESVGAGRLDKESKLVNVHYTMIVLFCGQKEHLMCSKRESILEAFSKNYSCKNSNSRGTGTVNLLTVTRLGYSQVNIFLNQGFSNFWCHEALEEVDHYLRSSTINF